AADLRRGLLLDVVEASRRRLLRSSADGCAGDPSRHHDRRRYRTGRAAGLDPAGAADELGGVSHGRDPVRRPARGLDRDHFAQRDADGGGRHHDRHPGCAASGGVEFRAVRSREGAGQRTRRMVARGRRCGRRRPAVEIHRAVFRPGDPDLAGQRSPVATLAGQPMALSRRPRGAGAVCAGPGLERRSPMGVLHQAARSRPRRGFQAGLHRRGDPDPGRVRNPAGVDARRDGALCAVAARTLINTAFWTIVAYFIWHSLHARVEANWFAPVYPAFAIAAAVAAERVRWETRGQRTVDFCLHWAAPTGVLMFALLVVQANTGALSGYRRDATVRSVGVGWRELAAGIEAVRDRVGAGCVLAPDYGTTGWLAFYLPKGTCVLQSSQRIRWVNMPAPDPSLLAGRLLYVDEIRPGGQPPFEARFAHVERVAELPRKRGPLMIETYAVDLLDGARGGVLDSSPPPELE